MKEIKIKITMDQNDISSILITKKIEAKILNIKSNKKVPLMQFIDTRDLPKKIDYKIDGSIFELLSYVSSRSEEIIATGKMPIKEKTFCPVKITSWKIIRSDNAQKFLVNLLIKKIIANLTLPILIQKKGQSFEIFIERYYFTEGLLEEQALYHQKEFTQRIISFDLISKSGFNKIKNKLESKKIPESFSVNEGDLRVNNIKKIQNEKKSNDLLSVYFGKQQLEINRNTGFAKLGKIESKLNPESQEFKTLINLMISKDYKATYEELLGDNPTKVNKRNLSFIVRNLKKSLGILPKKNARNKDIIKNIKRHGYMLIS